jgi:hypothetical protein
MVFLPCKDKFWLAFDEKGKNTLAGEEFHNVQGSILIDADVVEELLWLIELFGLLYLK